MQKHSLPNTPPHLSLELKIIDYHIPSNPIILQILIQTNNAQLRKTVAWSYENRERMRKKKQPTFADTICNTRSRKIKQTFFNQINNIIDWKLIENLINKHYTKGKSAVGTPSYSGLLLFKMSIAPMELNRNIRNFATKILLLRSCLN